jgi:hypothetical protein
MGPKFGGPVDEHPGSPETESQPQGAVFGGATPPAKKDKTMSAPCYRPPSRRWEARMGPKLGGTTDDHAGSPDAESEGERRGGSRLGYLRIHIWIYLDIYGWILQNN